MTYFQEIARQTRTNLPAVFKDKLLLARYIRCVLAHWTLVGICLIPAIFNTFGPALTGAVIALNFCHPGRPIKQLFLQYPLSITASAIAACVIVMANSSVAAYNQAQGGVADTGCVPTGTITSPTTDPTAAIWIKLGFLLVASGILANLRAKYSFFKAAGLTATTSMVTNLAIANIYYPSPTPSLAARTFIDTFFPFVLTLVISILYMILIPEFSTLTTLRRLSSSLSLLRQAILGLPPIYNHTSDGSNLKSIMQEATYSLTNARTSLTLPGWEPTFLLVPSRRISHEKLYSMLDSVESLARTFGALAQTAITLVQLDEKLNTNAFKETHPLAVKAISDYCQELADALQEMQMSFDSLLPKFSFVFAINATYYPPKCTSSDINMAIHSLLEDMTRAGEEWESVLGLMDKPMTDRKNTIPRHFSRLLLYHIGKNVADLLLEWETDSVQIEVVPGRERHPAPPTDLFSAIFQFLGSDEMRFSITYMFAVFITASPALISPCWFAGIDGKWLIIGAASTLAPDGIGATVATIFQNLCGIVLAWLFASLALVVGSNALVVWIVTAVYALFVWWFVVSGLPNTFWGGIGPPMFITYTAMVMPAYYFPIDAAWNISGRTALEIFIGSMIGIGMALLLDVRSAKVQIRLSTSQLVQDLGSTADAMVRVLTGEVQGDHVEETVQANQAVLEDMNTDNVPLVTKFDRIKLPPHVTRKLRRLQESLNFLNRLMLESSLEPSMESRFDESKYLQILALLQSNSLWLNALSAAAGGVIQASRGWAQSWYESHSNSITSFDRSIVLACNTVAFSLLSQTRIADYYPGMVNETEKLNQELNSPQSEQVLKEALQTTSDRLARMGCVSYVLGVSMAWEKFAAGMDGVSAIVDSLFDDKIE